MLGAKLYKGQYANKEYADLAVWCNANNATIEDKGDYYEVVAIPVHVPTHEELKKMFTDAIQKYLDTTAQERRYDNIFTAISYVNSTDEIFAREAQACLVWRDKVWRKCYDILDAVEDGEREIPTIEELISELPKIEWNDSVEGENVVEEGGTK